MLGKKCCFAWLYSSHTYFPWEHCRERWPVNGIYSWLDCSWILFPNISLISSNDPDTQYSYSYNEINILHLFKSPNKKDLRPSWGIPRMQSWAFTDLCIDCCLSHVIHQPKKQHCICLRRPTNRKHSADGVSLGCWPSIPFPLLAAPGVWVSHPDAGVLTHSLRCPCLRISPGLILFSHRWRPKLYQICLVSHLRNVTWPRALCVMLSKGLAEPRGPFSTCGARVPTGL